MRKLSEIINFCESKKDKSEPVIILFGDALDKNKVIENPEICNMAENFFGSSELSVIELDKDDKVQDYMIKQQSSAIMGNRSVIYPMKTRLKEMLIDNAGEEYGEPTNMFQFQPGLLKYPILTITCHLDDKIFKNDYYVIGAIVDRTDYDKIKK